MADRVYWSAPWTPLGSADGPAVTALALADASPIPQKPVPGGLEIGSVIRLHAQFELTSTSATPTLSIGFYLGTVGSIGTATAVAVAAALAIGAAPTAWQGEIDWEGEVRALGSSGQLEGSGTVKMPATTTGLTSAMSVFPLPQTAAARLVTVNTLVAMNLMVGAFWSSATGTPSLTVRRVTAEQLG